MSARPPALPPDLAVLNQRIMDAINNLLSAQAALRPSEPFVDSARKHIDRALNLLGGFWEEVRHQLDTPPRPPPPGLGRIR